ncbi:hypothetical protein H5410_044608 [Solanum commersonii]|uniref:Cytochrome P450 n=1 Tax=Solanum commersonii TaxID=4109 RepID=A0A9J5XA78_SOLCO|nr:hypothetical protein H5410_044608 [Solanum commersonii]
MNKMLGWIEKKAGSGGEVLEGIEVTRYVFLALFNMLGNLILSKDLVTDPESEQGSMFFNAMIGIMEWSGVPNISDIFPCLKMFDIQGSGKDEPAKLSEHEITIIILEMFLAGTETTSSSVEWELTELLRHPQAMAKVKLEISQFQERDIDSLPYMQAILKESLRLHPPLPFLIPRKAIQDTKFMGHNVPKGTQVLVNVWAIGRDPECWNDPFEFKPERFLESKVDVKGQNHELIPFGAGRRMCLLHEFDWELPHNVSPKSINMEESMGITTRKKQPLKVIPKRA